MTCNMENGILSVGRLVAVASLVVLLVLIGCTSGEQHDVGDSNWWAGTADYRCTDSTDIENRDFSCESVGATCWYPGLSDRVWPPYCFVFLYECVERSDGTLQLAGRGSVDCEYNDPRCPEVCEPSDPPYDWLETSDCTTDVSGGCDAEVEESEPSPWWQSLEDECPEGSLSDAEGRECEAYGYHSCYTAIDSAVVPPGDDDCCVRALLYCERSGEMDGNGSWNAVDDVICCDSTHSAFCPDSCDALNEGAADASDGDDSFDDSPEEEGRPR